MGRDTELLTAAGGRPEKVAVLRIGAGCNNNCSFCVSAGKSFTYNTAEVLDQIGAEAGSGADAIVFTGREPTIVPQFVSLVRAARDAGFRRIRLETNGRMFAYERFTRDAVAAGLTEVAVRLIAADTETALRINPVPGAFSQTLQGIKNLVAAGRGVKVSVSVPVVPENADSLGAVAALVKELGAPHITFSVAAGGAGTEGRVGEAVAAAGRLGLFVELRKGDESFTPDPKDPRIIKEDDEFCVDTYCEVGFPPLMEYFSRDIKVTYRCNQKCVFCGVDKIHAADPHERTLEAVRGAVEAGIPRLNISGGEPTLNPHLAEYIRIAKEGGVWEVGLMTNAMLLDRPGACEELRAAGLDKAFVSLHAHTAELSESITHAPRSFGKTVRGTHNLIDAGVATGLIFVLCSMNVGILPEYVRFAAAEFGQTPIFCSYATPYFEPTLPSDIVPRYEDSVSRIVEAFAAAAELGVPISLMEEQHGIPECVLPGRAGYFRNLFAPMSKESGAGFVKGAVCAACRESAACPGFRKYYALLHGMDEMKPII